MTTGVLPLQHPGTSLDFLLTGLQKISPSRKYSWQSLDSHVTVINQLINTFKCLWVGLKLILTVFT